jgi:DNA primase catalytic core
MSNITEWIKYELYPTLFESIDIAFPEHNFKRFAGDWRSKTYLTGEAHKDREDKVVITKQAIGLILEQGGEVLSLVDYVVKRDNVEFIEAVKTLAKVVGLQLPKGDLNPEEYKQYKEEARILEDCNKYFIYCLENSTGATEINSYLKERGYNKEDIKAMELGYIPSQAQLYEYLTVIKKYNKGLVDEVVKLNTGIGSTHSLTIPYRSGGSIKGFKFRTIGDHKPKYLNSTGLDRLGGFFNLSAIKEDKDIVIVEGELDSLSATARGLNNVVSTGGSSIAPEQIKDAVKRGAKSFTICFDTEPTKEEETAKRITSAIEVILGEGVNRVYIVTLQSLGEIKTDPDSYIKERGVESFREAISKALPYYEYKLQETINKYGKIEDSKGALEPRDIDNLLEEVVETASNIKDPVDKDRYKKLFTSFEAIKELGVTEESLSITVDRLTSTRDKEAQAKDFKKLLSEATQLQDKGEIDKALDLLDKKVKEVKLKDKATEFSSLLIPTSEAQIIEEEANLPDSLNSGFTIDKDELLLPSGAISVYAAPTNHGKTILLINTVLNVAERYPDKKFIFFTYEERDTSILQYFLNTYIDIDLNNSNDEYFGTNRRLIKDYFKTGSTQYINSKNIEYFKSKKEEFFKTYIETGRILVKYIDYNSQELTTAIEYLHKEEPKIGGVFIDYFQLLKLPKEKNSRQEELKQICVSLKDTAVETGLPLCLAAQFNREVTDLTKLHPTKVGEAGDIERIVNTLVGLWNLQNPIVGKDVSKQDKEIIDFKTGGAEKGMYIEMLKSRDLLTGSYEILDFNGNTGKVKNRAKGSSIQGSNPF